MTTRNTILILALILIPFLGKADKKAVEMHKFLFHSVLIAHAKIVSHTDHYYTIKILDVYRDHQQGIHVDDYIRIKRELNVITSVDEVHLQNIIDRETGVFFLSKHKKGWGVIDFCYKPDGTVRVPFYYEGCEIEGTPKEIKRQIQLYFKEFRLIEDEFVIGKLTADKVLDANLCKLVLLQYKQIFGTALSNGDLSIFHCEMDEPVEVVEDIEMEEAVPVIEYPEIRNSPISNDSLLILQTELRKVIYEKLPEMRKRGMEGTVAFKLFFELDGKISKVEVMRTIYGPIEKVLVKFFKANKYWSGPGLNEAGKPTRCSMIYPLRLKLTG